MDSPPTSKPCCTLSSSWLHRWRNKTNMLRSLSAVLLSLVCVSGFLFAQTSPGTPQASGSETTPQQAPVAAAAASFDQVIDRAIEREHFFMAQMRQLHPLVETYLQNLKPDKDLNTSAPASDVYFLGRLDLSNGTDDRAFVSPTTAGLGKRMLSKLGEVYTMKILPLGFAQMVILDQ